MKRANEEARIKYHWIPAFYTNEPQKGGELRTSQIGDILSSKKPSLYAYQLSKVQILYYCFLRILNHQQFPSVSLKNINQFACNYKALLSIKRDKHCINHVFWESTKDYRFASLLKQVGVRITALPHNIESYANNLSSFKAAKHFRKEVKAYKCAHELKVISQYDKSILEKVGLKAHWLPFQLSDNIKRQLEAAKSFKVQKSKKSFIILGTATNPPTKKGMEQLLSMLKGLPPNQFNFEFIGFGMSSLNVENELKNSIFSDSVSNADLFKKLRSATGSIIFQPETTGFLTRIMVLQYLQVPIMLNAQYAKLHPNLENIFKYRNVDELFDGLNWLSEN